MLYRVWLAGRINEIHMRIAFGSVDTFLKAAELKWLYQGRALAIRVPLNMSTMFDSREPAFVIAL